MRTLFRYANIYHAAPAALLLLGTSLNVPTSQNVLLRTWIHQTSLLSKIRDIECISNSVIGFYMKHTHACPKKYTKVSNKILIAFYLDSSYLLDTSNIPDKRFCFSASWPWHKFLWRVHSGKVILDIRALAGLATITVLILFFLLQTGALWWGDHHIKYDEGIDSSRRKGRCFDRDVLYFGQFP